MLIGLGDDNIAWGITLIVMVPMLTIVLATGMMVHLLNRHEGRKDAIISRLREQRPGTEGMKEACAAAFQYFDVDRSGYMNFQEMIEFMEELHPGDAPAKGLTSPRPRILPCDADGAPHFDHLEPYLFWCAQQLCVGSCLKRR